MNGKNALLQKMHDDSTGERFCFSLQCEECARRWASTAVPFSKVGETASVQKRVIHDILYKREKELAFCRAYQEAREHFNVCPVCGRLVCDSCFRICSDVDMCRACAESLGESGEQILPTG